MRPTTSLPNGSKRVARRGREARRVEYNTCGVDRKTARALEDAFLSAFLRNASSLGSLYSPLTRTAHETGSGVRVELNQDDRIRAMLRRLGCPHLFDEMPRNRAVLLDVDRRGWLGGKKTPLCLAGAAVAPLESLARNDRADAALSDSDLLGLRERIVTRPDVFYYVSAFSPTGWNCSSSLCSGPNWAIALVDRAWGGFRSRFLDPRPLTRRAFDLSTVAEKREMLRALLDRRLPELLLGEIDVEFLRRELGWEQEVALAVAEGVALSTSFLTVDDAGRIRREYRGAAAPRKEGGEPVDRVREVADQEEALARRIQEDVRALSEREEECLEEGARAEGRERERMARRVLRLRRRRKELTDLLEICQKRQSVWSEFAGLLQTARSPATLPTLEEFEALAARSQVAREKLEELASLAERVREPEEPAPEVEKILEELPPATETAPVPEKKKEEAPVRPKEDERMLE